VGNVGIICRALNTRAQLKSTANQLLSIFIQNQHLIIRAFKQTQHNPCAASSSNPLALWGLVGRVIYTQTVSIHLQQHLKNKQLDTTANLKHSQLEISSAHLIFSTVYTSHLYWYSFLINRKPGPMPPCISLGMRMLQKCDYKLCR